MRVRRWAVAVVVPLVLAAISLRIAAALRPGLWADEIFSLAMATGHSLEHPAVVADAARGDFVEGREPRSAADLRRYAEHETEPAEIGRVVRAVLLSDTSPPLYYVVLNRWTRAFGTGDAALRLFSVWWALLALPLIWLIGRELGGMRAAWSAVLLFAFSPVAMDYSVEGRMYTLVWFLALALGWLTLRLSRRSAPGTAAGWVVVGSAGLLTHYFFAFVWLACVAWLGWSSRRAARGRLGVMACLTILLVAPWYREVPASLARWRITAGWLDGDLRWPGALGRPFALAGGLVSGNSTLGGWHWADRAVPVLLLLLALWLLRERRFARLFAGRRLLVWLWLLAACAGPLVFDLLRHTTTSNVPRYVLAGLPAALLLVAFGASRLPATAEAAFVTALLAVWLPGSLAPARAGNLRPWEPYRAVAGRLEGWAQPNDAVVVAAIPSGLVGVARYLDRDIPLLPWVSQLGNRRVPDDLERLLAGRRRVALVSIHDLGGSAAPGEWLRAHARLLRRDSFRSSRAEVLYFAPAGGGVFFPPVAGR